VGDRSAVPSSAELFVVMCSLVVLCRFM